ncbi:MAG: thiamine pyrophosphate-binding protein, partial [Calditrichaeota bacterium]|nr:thiamine pyrophosphate-binding protein [Calditrichota bacterium]
MEAAVAEIDTNLKRPKKRSATRSGVKLKPETLSGSEILIRSLVAEGVEIVFGYPGGVVLGLYDAIFKNACGLRHILIRHEQGGTHAADGYAR